MSITVLCPSRGRPGSALEVAQSVRNTARNRSTRLLFLVDADDPMRDDYIQQTAAGEVGDRLVIDPPPGCMNVALNRGVAQLLADPAYAATTVFGFVGDDHRFRTAEWDLVIDRFLDEHPGIAYADDLLQRINLPTMWFVSRKIVEVFGMGHPDMRHLWIDNYWRELGEAAGCLYYFSHIVIEHMHPIAGKAAWDDNYRRVNSPEIADHDRGVFDRWRVNDLARDADQLRALIAHA